MTTTGESSLQAAELEPLLNPAEPMPWLRRRGTAEYARDVYYTVRRSLASERWYIFWVFPLLGIIAVCLDWDSRIVSTLNFLAIIPLSVVISSASDQLSNYSGDTWGGLINATFGNAVELTAGILALIHGEVLFAQSVMIGSMLSDILLIFGFSLVSASYNQHILTFNPAIAGALSSLMMITAVTLTLPTALYSTFQTTEISDRIVSFSRGTAIVMLLLYLGYMYFHLWTHKHLFGGPEVAESDDGDGDEPTSISRLVSVIIRLVVAGALTVICTNNIMQELDETTKLLGVSKTFIAIILIPIASNSPEGSAVIAASRNGNADFATAVIVDSILQIGLFVIPLLVTLGWFINQPMTLYFETFQTVVLFLSVLVVNHLQDGKYVYLHGVMLIALYAILAIYFWAR